MASKIRQCWTRIGRWSEDSWASPTGCEQPVLPVSVAYRGRVVLRHFTTEVNSVGDFDVGEFDVELLTFGSNRACSR